MSCSSESDRPLNILEFQRQPSVDGVTVDVCSTSDCCPDSVSSSLTTTRLQIETAESPCTVESLVLSNEMTYADSKLTFEVTISNTQTKANKRNSLNSTTSAPASTSNVQAFCPFWDASKKKVYDALSWLPKTASLASDSSSSSGCASSMIAASWFSIEKIEPQVKSLDRTYWPSCKFTVADGTAKGAISEQKMIKAYKLKLRPTQQQKATLRHWAGAARYTYNKTSSAMLKATNPHGMNWMGLRNRFVTNKTRAVKGKEPRLNSFFTNKQWLLDTPKAIRLMAVKDAVAARKACFSNLKAGNITHFSSSFRTKRNEKTNGWSLGMDCNNISVSVDDALYIFKDKLGPMHYYKTKQLKKIFGGASKPAHGCRVQKDRYGDYYLVVPVTVKVKTPPTTHTKVLSCDPGEKIYITAYDPSGIAYKIGANASDEILQHLHRLDRGVSKASKLLGRRRREQDLKNTRLRRTIHNLKQELHNQVNNYLVKHSTLLLYPKLDTKRLSSSEHRTLTTKVVRKMMNLGHGAALDKLRNKCKERGVQLIVAAEEYTTQTCPLCGALNSCDHARQYHCRPCGYHMDRDLNGSENVLLKAVARFRVVVPKVIEQDGLNFLTEPLKTGLEGPGRSSESSE